MHVDIEARVITRDRKKVGKVGKVVIHPRTNEVVDLIVHRTKGLLDVRDVVVPRSAVAEAVEGEVKLSLTAAQLDRLPDYCETDYVPPPPEWFIPAPYPPGGILWPAGYAAIALIESEHYNVPPGTVTITERTPVDCPDGHIGVVDEIVSDPANRRVRGFIVRRGTILTHDVFIPIAWVARVGEDHVLLNRTKPEVARLAERAAT